MTLDGHKYTFNGRGEFSLIETLDDSFTLQGRMVEIENENTSTALGTVFHAIVAREGKSDTVQFEIVNKTLTVLVNGEVIDFQVLEQEFKGVTLSDEGNNILLAYFSSGAYIQTKKMNGIISSLTISLPENYRNTPIQGLLGNFNGDPSDDLLPKLGQTPLPENSTLQEIHEQFGLTCKYYCIVKPLIVDTSRCKSHCKITKYLFDPDWLLLASNYRSCPNFEVNNFCSFCK